MKHIIMKKLLFILPVLLLSSTVQINAMQDDDINNQLPSQNDNERTQILDKISNKLNEFNKLDKNKKEEILNNISKISEVKKMYLIFDLLDTLPLDKTTTEILINISKINEDTLSELSNVFYDLPNAGKTTEILLSISETNDKYALYCICSVLYLFEEVEKVEERLLKIIKYISKRKNNISILKDIESVLNNLPKKGKSEYILFNISKMNKDSLYALSKVLDILPKSEITEDILFNLSKMNKYKLVVYLYLVLYYLPENERTTDVLLNISNNIRKMDMNKLRDLSNVLKKLPLDKVTIEILTNILTMDNSELNSIYRILDELPSDKVTIELLTNISKINNKYALDWIYNVLRRLSEVAKTKDILLNISTSKINDINTLRKTKSLFSNLQGDGEPGDLFFKIGKNIGNMNMNKDKLYALSKVLDELQEVEITENVLFNITKIDKNELFRIYNIFSLLPKSAKTKKILLNISKIDNKNTLFIICYILERFNILQLNNITEEILFNIINMNRYPLTLMCYIFNEICNLNKSQLNKIKKETLLNIIKYIIEKKDSIRTLKDIELVLSNLPETEGIKNLFINIRKNISEMDKDALSKIEANINKNNNVDNLDVICDIINKLSPDKITPDILTSISTMNCGYFRLSYLSKIISKLPEAAKTPDILLILIEMDYYALKFLYDLINRNMFYKLLELGKITDTLFNISGMNCNTLKTLFHVFCEKLPEEGKTEKILRNIIKMNEDTLENLYKKLDYAQNDKAKMQVLREFGVLQ